MTARRQIARRIGCVTARLGAVGSAGMLLLTILGTTVSQVPTASAAIDGGAAQVVTPFDAPTGPGQFLGTGGSATPFSLLLPAGAACTGDSANDGYRVQTYMVPAAIDPATLTFNAAGPLPTALGAGFRQPLYQMTSAGYVDAQTANAASPGAPGPVVAPPAFNFGLFAPGDVPAGEYSLGIACTRGPASATQIDKFWNARLTVAANESDQPAGITWTATQASTTTTTSTTSSTTSTTTGGSTSSTSASSASTSTSFGDTTLTSADVAVLAGGGSPSGTSVVGSVSQLPTTGSSTTALVVWAGLLLVFGRMAVLLGRPPRVRPAVPA